MREGHGFRITPSPSHGLAWAADIVAALRRLLARPFLRALPAIAAAAMLSSAAEATPAANLLSAPLVSPTSAWSFYGASTTHTAGVAAWSQSPPEIQALARALGANRLSAGQFTQNVFDYVRNNIDVEFRFGLGKGGRGALVDQSGTPFDQAELMVKLLRLGGVTATYQVGTIGLSAQQFGQWSGLVNSLNQAAQTFSVDARQACQFLADGAIPATVNGATDCSTLSGNLAATGTPIQMGHIWVSANGNLYDPSFKTYLLKTGIDVSAAIGCGAAAAPTCGSAITAAGLTGATTGTDSGGAYIQHYNDVGTGGLNAKLVSLATSLQNYIQGSNRIASLQDIVGGAQLQITPSPFVSGTLSYVVSTTVAWSGDIPDQYRTKLRVRVGDMNNAANGFSDGYPVDQTFFADELAGRRLQVVNGSTYTNMQFMLDNAAIASPLCTAGCSHNTVSLDVDHPYASAGGAYADEHIDYGMPAVDTDYSDAAVPITIVNSWGNPSEATDQHIAAFQETNPSAVSAGVTLINQGQSNGGYIQVSDYENSNQAVLAGKLLGQGSQADRLIAGLGHVRVTRHHDVGIVYAAPYDPSSTSYISISSALSVNTATSDTTMRSPVFETEAATWAMLEGAVNAQVQGMKTGLWAGTFFWSANINAQKFYLSGTGTNGSIGASAGSVTFSPTSVAYLLYGMIKGGGSLSSDPLHVALDTVKVDEMGANRKKYLSVSPADGSATISVTDITTGTGKFPESLPFQRTYHSGATVSERAEHSDGYTEDGNNNFAGSTNSTNWRYSGPDSASNSRLGGGWTHNYQVTASYASNNYKAFGSETALDASTAIAALWSFMDAARNPVLANRLAMISDSFWLSKMLAFNSVVVDKGGATEAFQRLPDGSFNSLAGAARLVQTNESVVNTLNGTEDFTPVTFLYTGKDGDTISFDWAHQNMHPFTSGFTVSSADPAFKANLWSFPDGTKVTFNYSFEWLVTAIGQAPITCSGGGFPGINLCIASSAPYYPKGYVLQSVSNNRGRTLTFTETPSYFQVIYPGGGAANITSSFQITRVTDDNGRHVDYALSGCPTVALSLTARFACSTLTATGPVVTGITPAVNKYTYATEVDAVGNPTSNYKLNAWYSPGNQSTPYQSLAYDSMFHTATVTDILGHATNYYAGSSTSIDIFKHGDVVDPMLALTTSIFDRWNSLLSTTNALNATVTYAYDNARRKTLETLPLGDSTGYTYDNRSNTLTTTVFPSPGSTLAPIATQTTYMEGPTVNVCANILTCNKPSTETNARGYVTQYCWESTSGLLLSFKKGLTAGVACPFSTHGDGPETDLAYTWITGSDGSSLRVLDTKTDWITVSTNVVTKFTYNPSNHDVLQTVAVDPTNLNRVTTLAFDSIGDLTQIDGPRTDVSDITNYAWDTANRRLTFAIQADPDGVGVNKRPTTKYVWDIDGQLTETDRGLATTVNGSDFSATLVTTTTYDAAGNKIQDTTPTRVTQYSYDADDRPLCAAVRMNFNSATGTFGAFPSDTCALSTPTTYGQDRIVKKVYDAVGQVLQEIRGFATTNQITYATNHWSLNGKLASVYDADGMGHQTFYSYDGFDRLRYTTFADGTFEQLGYYDGSGNLCSSNGQPCTKADRSLQTFTFTYDALDRLATKLVPAVGSVPANTVTMAYDLLDRVTGSSDTNGNTVATSFDVVGCKKSESRTTPTLSAKTANFDCDQAGNRKLIAWPDGYSVTYVYDALNHPLTVTDSDGLQLAGYGYDTLARPATLQYAGSAGAKMLYSWSAEDDLLTQQSDFAGSANDVTFTNDFTPAHQWNSSTISNGAFRFTPPASASIAYGAVNGTNEYASFNGTAVSYDLRGNYLGATASPGLTYDSENRLMTATSGGGTTYAYDAGGRRTLKNVAGTATNFLHDSDTEIAEYSGSGVLQRRFVPGPAIDDYIAMVTAAGLKTFFHTDKMGSVIAMSDTGGNMVEGPYTYDGYGNCTQGGAACGAGVPFRYTGQRWDAETSLYYYRARYYFPSIGRFLQNDPVGYKDDLDLYTYVGNDPTDRVDPSGLLTQVAIGGRVRDNILGHAWIRINGKAYSFGTRNAKGTDAHHRDWGIGAATMLKAEGQKGRSTVLITLNISTKQEKALQQRLDGKNPNAEGAPGYSALGNNCVDQVQNALTDTGIIQAPSVTDQLAQDAPSGVLGPSTPSGLQSEIEEQPGLVKSETTVGHPDSSYLGSVAGTILGGLGRASD